MGVDFGRTGISQSPQETNPPKSERKQVRRDV